MRITRVPYDQSTLGDTWVIEEGERTIGQEITVVFLCTARAPYAVRFAVLHARDVRGVEFVGYEPIDKALLSDDQIAHCTALLPQ